MRYKADDISGKDFPIFIIQKFKKSKEWIKMRCKNCNGFLTRDSIGWFHKRKAVNWKNKECTNPEPLYKFEKIKGVDKND